MSTTDETSTTGEVSTVLSQTILTDLSPDCLAHIFRYLSLKDLNAVNATCKYFHDTIVSKNLHKYHSRVTYLDLGEFFRRYDTSDSDHKLDYINAYLQRFGHIIKEIKFEMNGCKTEYNRIFTFIIDYCSDALKSLQMANIKLDLETISKGHLIFSYLTELEVDRYSNLTPLLKLCVNLTELRLTSGIDYHVPFDLDFTFPMLQKFAITYKYEEHIKHDVEIPGLNKGLENFFKEHPDLKSLTLKLPQPLNVDLMIPLSGLEEIYFNGSLQIDSVNLLPLSDFSHIRKVEVLQFYDFQCGEFLNKTEAAYSLDHLTLDLVPIDNVGFVSGLSRFPCLTYLSLSTFFQSELPETEWEKLGNLQELTELHLSDVHQNDHHKVATRFIKYLTGAHQTLEKFSLTVGWRIDVDFVLSLAKFECLQTLELAMEMDDIQRNLDPFHHLTSLKELTLKSKQSILNRSIQQNVLTNLSSLSALEKLELNNFSDDGVFVKNSETLQFVKM